MTQVSECIPMLRFSRSSHAPRRLQVPDAKAFGKCPNPSFRDRKHDGRSPLATVQGVAWPSDRFVMLYPAVFETVKHSPKLQCAVALAQYCYRGCFSSVPVRRRSGSREAGGFHKVSGQLYEGPYFAVVSLDSPVAASRVMFQNFNAQCACRL